MLLLPKSKFFKNPNEHWTNELPEYQGFDIGDWTTGLPKIVGAVGESKLKIGRFCAIGEDTVILLNGQHTITAVSTYRFDYKLNREKINENSDMGKHKPIKKNIILENDVWIGRDSYILPGAYISNGVIVGARAMVSKFIPPYSIVVETNKIIKQRFSDEVIEELQKIAWWNWDIDKVLEAIPFMYADDVWEFINRYKV